MPQPPKDIKQKIMARARTGFARAIQVPRETHYTNRVAACMRVLSSSLDRLEAAVRESTLENVNRAIKKMEGMSKEELKEVLDYLTFDAPHQEQEQ